MLKNKYVVLVFWIIGYVVLVGCIPTHGDGTLPVVLNFAGLFYIIGFMFWIAKAFYKNEEKRKKSQRALQLFFFIVVTLCVIYSIMQILILLR